MKIFKKVLLGAIALGMSSNLLSVNVIGAGYTTPSGIKSSDVESSVDGLMRKLIGDKSAGASVSVSEGDKIVFSNGYGLADVDKKLRVDRNTTFNFASISKLFIWVSAMQLSEQGKLDLNKDIREYLPDDYPLHIISENPVTFINLMNHNAGFEARWSYTSGSGESRDFSSLEEAVHNCYSGIQCFEPGQFQGYSNYGANLAALIIEKVSGVLFYEYVRKNIFEPCGMNACYPEVESVDSVIKNRAKGYARVLSSTLKETTLEETLFYTGDWLYASGSVVGNAEALSKFAIALMPAEGESTPLFRSNETLNEMFKISYSPTGTELFSVHHGFWGTDGTYRGIGHTGCVDGMVSHFVIVPEKRFSVAVLSNDQDGWDVVNGVVSLLTGNDYDKPSEFKGGTDIFEGEYVQARTQFVGRKRNFDVIKVKSLDSKNIRLSTGNNSQVYRRIGQNLFENVTAKSGRYFKSKVYFKIVDGKVEKAVTFKNDLIPMAQLERFVPKP